MAKYKRRIKLIKPSLQLRLTLVFVGLSTMALLLQFVLLASNLSQVALRLPNDGQILVDEMSSTLLGSLATAFVVFIPIVFAVGVLTTFRIAGPLYRFEMFMKQVASGQQPADCKIRKTDQLQDFCVLLNEVTRPLRTPETEPETSAAVDLDTVQSLITDEATAATTDSTNPLASDAPLA